MYARYIPPPKATASSPIQSKAKTDIPPKKPTDDSPKAPTDGYSYARYVPSTSPASKAISSPGTTKRKRESEDALSLQAIEKKPRTDKVENGVIAAEKESSEVVNADKKKKNRRKRKQRTKLDDGDGLPDSHLEESHLEESHLEESHLQESNDHSRSANGINDDDNELDSKAEAADLAVPVQEEAISRSDKKGEEEESKKMKKKKKEKKKKHVGSVDDVAEEEKEDTRHKAVLERKAKSLVLASKAAPDTGPASEGEAAIELHGLQPLPQPAVVADDETKPTYDSLPAWLANPIRVPQDSRTSFEALGIAPKTARALGHKGFTEAFAIQTAAIPLLLPSSKHEPGDVLISAATGSGKTMAYTLPIVRDVGQGVLTRLRALVVLPTRELVKQAQEVFEVCARAYDGEDRKKVRVGVAIGNQSMQAEQEMLMASESRYDPDAYNELREKVTVEEEEDGRRQLGGWDGEVVEWSSKVDVLICTPGRLVEHMEQTVGFSLDYVRWLVVDEADKLMAQSFQGWLDRVLDRFRRTNGPFGARDFPDMAYSGVRKVMVSATLKRDPGLVHRLALKRPRLLLLEGKDDRDDDDNKAVTQDDEALSAEHTLPAELREFAVRVHETSLKPLYLLDLLRGGQMEASLKAEAEPDESTDSGPPPPLPPPCLVFTKSNESALRLARLLELLDPSLSSHVQSLTSTTSTQTRRKTLRALNSPSKSGVRVVVASDLVARGIDIPRLGHVINYDLPASVAGYVHRVGRTARAGRGGCAWTLLPDPDSGWFWGRIVKGGALGRMHEVERTRIEEMGEEKTRRYEEALAELGREAVEVRRG
ncbi:hypothetical protein CP532_6656 [Ophiocordyceps camponoti-leonardi (nom. inval.)]|nr:hypothetical protein CP532_6656 [Ophiocordyceps camponoti-leonardi (nom. inval.)]